MESKIADMDRAIFETELLKENRLSKRVHSRADVISSEIVRIGNFIEGGTSNKKWTDCKKRSRERERDEGEQQLEN